MNKLKIFGNIIFTIVVIVFLVFLTSFVYEKYYSKKQVIDLENNLTDEKSELENIKDRSPLNTKISLPENDKAEDSITGDNVYKFENEDDNRESKFEISTSDDCKNECKDYENDINKFNYCKQICGLVPMANSNLDESISNNNKNTTNCENLASLDKDYCWRNLAIDEKNFDNCKKIEDKNIYQQCKNRITEDIIDNQF